MPIFYCCCSLYIRHIGEAIMMEVLRTIAFIDIVEMITFVAGITCLGLAIACFGLLTIVYPIQAKKGLLEVKEHVNAAKFFWMVLIIGLFCYKTSSSIEHVQKKARQQIYLEESE